jgi:hypothetical protein
MGGKYLSLSATGVVLGLTGSICICLAFFTSSWLNVIEEVDVENSPQLDTNKQEAAESPKPGLYGLWDHGPSDFKKSFLNCEAIPFSVCMYTRAGLFSAVILIVPAMLLALLSAAVLASHGQLHTTGTLARASSGMFLLACLGSTSGMLAFTLQMNVCISTCPPDYTYFPQTRATAEHPIPSAHLAWSFYIGWVGSGLLLMAASALLALSCEAAGKVQESKIALARAMNNPLSRPNIAASQVLSQHSGKV